MNILYLDCGMGAAGDMLTAALLELFPQPQKIIDELNTLGVPHVEFSTKKSFQTWYFRNPYKCKNLRGRGTFP